MQQNGQDQIARLASDTRLYSLGMFMTTDEAINLATVSSAYSGEINKIRIKNLVLSLLPEDNKDLIPTKDFKDIVEISELDNSILRCQNGLEAGVKPFIDLMNHNIQSCLLAVCQDDPTIAKKVWNMPIFKSLLPESQKTVRPEANFLTRCSAGLLYGLLLPIGSAIVTACILVGMGIYAAGALVATPLNFLYNLLFNRKNIISSLSNNLMHVARSLALTVINVASLLYAPLNGCIKGMLGGFYYANLKDYKQIIKSLYNPFNLKLETMADTMQNIPSSIETESTSKITQLAGFSPVADPKPNFTPTPVSHVSVTVSDNESSLQDVDLTSSPSSTPRGRSLSNSSLD